MLVYIVGFQPGLFSNYATGVRGAGKRSASKLEGFNTNPIISDIMLLSSTASTFTRNTAIAGAKVMQPSLDLGKSAAISMLNGSGTRISAWRASQARRAPVRSAVTPGQWVRPEASMRNTLRQAEIHSTQSTRCNLSEGWVSNLSRGRASYARMHSI